MTTLPGIAPLSKRADFVPSYIEYTMPTDAGFMAKYGALAQFRCRTCKTEWRRRPGFVFCPRGDEHHFIDWVNYEEICRLLGGE